MLRRYGFRLATIAIAALALGSAFASATFGDPATSMSNVFSADVLNAPTALSATVAGTTVNLSWTGTSDTYASGHRVLRGTVSGGPYTQIAQITPRTTTTYANSTGGGTFYYVVRAYFQNWESADSNQVSAIVTTNTGLTGCSANAAVTTNSGDNNGFQLNPGNACADDAAFAEDTNSGTASSAVCSSTARDRHLFYNYGFSIPAGATINGIEVRLDAWADSTAGTPQICVELSWNGGTTWTAAKTTAALTATQATYMLGSASDTWGRTWSAAELSNANLRVRLTMVASSTARAFRLDWVPVRVTYTP